MSTRVEPRGSLIGENGHTTETELAGATPSRVRLVGTANRVRTACEPFWVDWRIGVAAFVAAAASWGLMAGWWTPRSPLTTSQAIWSIVISLFAGGVGGLLMRSRWTLVIGPLVFAVVVELTRLGTAGPTVDMPAFTTYGILALVVGRGFHALVALAPMAFGAVIGAGIARHLDDTPAREHQSRRWALRARRGVAALAAVGLVGFTGLLARPAGTDRIVDADGNRAPGSIAELSTIDVNGHELDVMIRGHSVPICGFSDLGPNAGRQSEPSTHSTWYSATRSRWTSSQSSPGSSPLTSASRRCSMFRSQAV